jgi:hypothetical protein
MIEKMRTIGTTLKCDERKSANSRKKNTARANRSTQRRAGTSLA